jgi:acetoin utilization protein AcuC
MPVYAGYDSYKLAFESIVEPVTAEFKPQIIIRNGGSDPHFADGLTELGLPLRGFRMIGDKVREMAEVCDGKVIDLIASGYNPRVLPNVWLALITGLCDIKLDIEEPVPVPPRLQNDPALKQTKVVIEEVKKSLKGYWRCLSRG